METRCPECHTIFRIAMEQLSVAKGQVRCGQCNHVFNAADEMVVNGTVVSSKQDHAETTTVEVPEVEGEAIASESNKNRTNADDEGYDITVLYPELENPPVIHTPPSTKTTLTWSILIICMLAIMLGQFSYFLRDNLARNNTLRPLLLSMCEIMNCELKGQRAPALVRLQSHKVQSHPKDSSALRVEAVIINDASFIQDYPVVRLQFSDLDGRMLATRNFLPDHYLPTDVDRKSGMTPGEPVNTVLDIVDPGKNAISYEFEFL